MWTVFVRPLHAFGYGFLTAHEFMIQPSVRDVLNVCQYNPDCVEVKLLGNISAHLDQLLPNECVVLIEPQNEHVEATPIV